MSLFDISVPIESTMAVWPGDPPVSVERTLCLEDGDPATVSRLVLGSHTGTHVDTFSHFLPGGDSLDDMDLNRYIGKALVVEIADPRHITRRELEALDLPSKPWPDCKRLLFKTRNSQSAWSEQPFNRDFVHIHPEAAEYLAAFGVDLVGIDYLSVEGFHAVGAPTHHCLLAHGVYVLEGLYLGDVSPGWYELICLPMKIKHGDGAPARAVLRQCTDDEEVR